MSRGARRRAERLAKKVGGEVGQTSPQMIKLENPVTEHFESFIFANATVCERVVEAGSAVGRTLVICGAGPSLADEAAEWADTADDLWACNSALPWLIERGHKPTHAITVDQTPAMVVEWASAPDVEYLMPSTAHPHLTEHLLTRGRRLTWFHNFVGISRPPVEWCECGHNHEGGGCDECDCTEYDPTVMSFEDWMYLSLYPGTIRVGAGLNTATRAIDLALSMGYDRITVLGADCAMRVKRPLPRGTVHGSAAHRRWLETETLMHADGGNALASGATAVTLGGYIDGRWWESKPDMMISAVFMVKMRELYGHDRLRYIGDTLPNALEGKSEEFLAKLPALVDGDGKPIAITISDPLQTGDIVAPALPAL